MIFLYLLLMHVQHHIFPRNLPLVRWILLCNLSLPPILWFAHYMPNGMVYCCISVEMFLKPSYGTFDTWNHYSVLTLLIIIILIIKLWLILLTNASNLKLIHVCGVMTSWEILPYPVALGIYNPLQDLCHIQ